MLEAVSTQGPQCGRRELSQWESPMTPSGTEPATFRLVAHFLDNCVTACRDYECGPFAFSSWGYFIRYL